MRCYFELFGLAGPGRIIGEIMVAGVSGLPEARHYLEAEVVRSQLLKGKCRNGLETLLAVQVKIN